MEKSIIELLRYEFPDLDEFLGELWLVWPEISKGQLNYRSSADRWDYLIREVKKVRRAVHNEGRPSNTLKFSEMHDDIEVVDRIISDPHYRRYKKRPGRGSDS